MSRVSSSCLMAPSFQFPKQLPGMILPGCHLIPHNGLPLYVFEEHYREMLSEVLDTHRMFFVAEAVSEEMAEELGGVATGRAGVFAAPFAGLGMARVCLQNEDGTSHLILQGLKRIRILDFDAAFSYPMASIATVETALGDSKTLAAARRKIEERVEKLDGECAGLRTDLLEGLQGAEQIEVWTDMMGARLLRSSEVLRSFLAMDSLEGRLELLWSSINRMP